MSNEIKRGDGMYGKSPRVEVGGLTISDNGEGRIWIERRDGEGGEFLASDAEKVLHAFYDANF